ncbi:Gfo/Idh/MocA family oxidoreductase [Aurantibacter sp.]|uniref:Gfo/Idh/MocA family protein n=1 Tax=Aurantibacter sp. TaxID=2807103 RepID=UPI00326758E5
MKRRQFAIRSGLASLALTTSNFSLGAVLRNRPNPICNIGIIGTGVRGTEMISYINQIPYFNITACCDIIPSRLENALQLCNNTPTAHKDYRNLLSQKNIDAVLIATPFNSHSKITIDAINKGKHVYCESTLAKGYHGISNLSKSIKNINIIVQAGHQYRSFSLYSQVKDLILKGAIGKINAIDCVSNINGNWRIPVKDFRLEKLINWRMYREFSGGLVAEMCAHQVDYINWILDAVPKKVEGKGANDYFMDNREIFDNIILQYTYPDNLSANFVSKTSSEPTFFEIKIIGSMGTINLDLENAWIETNGQKTIIEVIEENPSKQALINFKESIEDKKSPISNVQSAIKTAIAVQMGIDTLLHNKAIYWKTGLGD